MPTLRTLRNKADAQARALGHHIPRFSTMHSHAMWGTCADCGAHVCVSDDREEVRQISGAAVKDTCAEYKARHPQEYTEKKSIRGKVVPCRRLGEWTDDHGRRYTAWRSAVNDRSAYIRMEPFDGGRASFWYDPGTNLASEIQRQAREQTQTGA